MEIASGARLGRYEIRSKIGEGGMGEVYLAEDTKLDRNVALKVLRAEVGADRSRMNRFVQEAKAASALNHPNIITIHEIDASDSGHFIATEFIDGETVRERLRKAPLSVSEALNIAVQVAAALAAAHQAGIIHRDIKPENVMVRQDGFVKVLDFGLAKLTTSNASDAEAATRISDTQPGMIMGTVAYMSPEQARGQAVDARTDVWSLGVMLYEMLSRRTPFRGETASDTVANILHREPDALNLGTVPDDLTSIIETMLAKEIESRYRTSAEVASDLKKLQRRIEFDSEMQETSLRSTPLEAELKVTASTSLPKTSPQSVDSAAARADQGFWVGVLPFKYRGSTAELDELAEGLTEEIVTGLSRFSYLRVIARSSTLRYANRSADVRTIGSELGARYMLEGSLRQAGAKVRLAVQLVEATNGAQLWAETYERTFSPQSVFDLQDELVPHIVSTIADLHGVLPRSMGEAVRGKPIEQLTPYEALLRSFRYSERVTPEVLADARAALELAVQNAPAYADAWAMLTTMYTQDYAQGFNLFSGSLTQAEAAGRKAVELAPSNHLAWFALAAVHFFQKELQSFRYAVERSVTLNPMDGNSLAHLGELVTFAGDFDRGLELSRRAKRLNPHHPGWYWYADFYQAFSQNDYEAALGFARKVNLPGHWAEPMLTAAAASLLGDRESAAKAVTELLALRPDIGATVRRDMGKWWSTAVVELLVDGLRKTGLKVTDDRTTNTPAVAEKSMVSSASIAVLPFVNLSNDQDNEYFCDGLAEELLNALSKIDELKVAARTSAFSFKGKNAKVGDIANALNVNTVLEGSVRKSNNRVRITTQLVNAADGYHLWSERYDREMKDIFDVQDEITVAVVEALKVKLLGAEKSAILKRHTRNSDAYELYLRGLSHFNRFSTDGFLKAIESFNRAIAIDPAYASAYAGLALAYTEMSFFSFAPKEWMAKASATAQKAFELDDTLGEAHNALAIIKMYYEWDYSGAEQEFQRAIFLNPGSAFIHNWYGWYLGLMARFDESLKEFQRAQELDPLSDTINSGIGIILHWSRQPARAIEQFREVLELNPNYLLAIGFLAEAYVQLGDFAPALAAVERLKQIANDPLMLPIVGYVYAKCGERDEALTILKELERHANQEYEPALNFAQVYTGLGDAEQAFAWLEQACTERSVWMSVLKVDVKFDLLRSDPRFQDILRRVGIT